ncbi:CRISPR-associated protein TM1812 [Halorhodospira halochloris]|uniref:CRISPR-associated protein TM1812 n=1 Tax=Halorhodospira halochloris TaxID=1052 RepID=A0A0X8XCY4_HALHR|nr:TIGR02221 family CRISPR-associated protein [Halorhodospira halochloris]MBK1651894.1 TIGR02221 family CRISPR-associated protein [Halorhodospira halochloris]BAU58764.1 CRISPR-associated protein TM1812 [Halorhodospira halochloris]
MHTLVSFIGRTRRPEQGYERIAYNFPDGAVQNGIAFIGNGVAQYTKPDRLVILGTSGSMWDQVIVDYPEVKLGEEKDLALSDSVDNQATTAEQLSEVAAALSETASFTVDLRLIPETPGMEQTWEILHTLVDATSGSDRLTIDITHGFRHLPMVAMMAALYRRTLDDSQSFSVDALWYAQLPPGAKEAEMHNIVGILALADWMEAIQHSRTTGDLSRVAELLREEAPEIAENLAQGSFKETIHQGTQARGPYRKARKTLSETTLPGPAGLFQPILEDQISWVDGQHLHVRQAAHARSALERKDYLRAALYGYEAFVTQLTREHHSIEQLDHHEKRKAASDAFAESCQGRSKEDPKCRAFHQLRQLRNALAHGDQPKHADVQAALHSPQALHKLLSEALDRLLP